MIIELLLNGVYNILNLILILDIPDLAEGVHEYIATFFDYVVAGASIIVNYVPWTYIIILFGQIVAIDAGLLIYHFCMWVLKKVPFINVK